MRKIVWTDDAVGHLEAIERAFEENKGRSGLYAYENEQQELTAVEDAQFRKRKTGWANWESQPAGYRKTVLHWITSAKRPETRAKRLAQLIEDSAAGRRIAQYDWQKKP